MRVQLLRLGAPADRFGDVYAPGCLKPATVPVTRGFDGNKIVGVAHIHEDGSADVELTDEGEQLRLGLLKELDIGIGFVAKEWTEESDGTRNLKALDAVCLGVSDETTHVEKVPVISEEEKQP